MYQHSVHWHGPLQYCPFHIGADPGPDRYLLVQVLIAMEQAQVLTGTVLKYEIVNLDFNHRSKFMSKAILTT